MSDLASIEVMGVVFLPVLTQVELPDRSPAANYAKGP